MTPHDDPMGRLPELPSDIAPFAAGMWAGTVLMQAAAARRWPRDTLRMQVLLIAAGLAGDATDEQLHAELQQVLDASRAHLAGKQ